MTIQVTITNKDDNRTIEVVERNFSKETGRSELGSPMALGPGQQHTFYCYHLRDLIVREQDMPGRY